MSNLKKTLHNHLNAKLQGLLTEMRVGGHSAVGRGTRGRDDKPDMWEQRGIILGIADQLEGYVDAWADDGISPSVTVAIHDNTDGKGRPLAVFMLTDKKVYEVKQWRMKSVQKPRFKIRNTNDDASQDVAMWLQKNASAIMNEIEA